ncbi:MAG TPA: hypothetical protein VFE45_09060 [Coriobacteriia bacterium]|nr:hypothetical protein [Coriobacteriia bacterium]
MHATELIDIGIELLPRRARRFIGVLLALALVSGVGTPLVMWYVTTKATELTEDLAPAVTRLVDPSMAPTTP